MEKMVCHTTSSPFAALGPTAQRHLCRSVEVDDVHQVRRIAIGKPTDLQVLEQEPLDRFAAATTVDRRFQRILLTVGLGRRASKH